MSGSHIGTNGRERSGPRCIAIVGPFQSGKTTLLEAILERTGVLQRAGRVTEGNAVATNFYEAAGFRSFGIEPRAIKIDGKAFAKNHMYIDLTSAP